MATKTRPRKEPPDLFENLPGKTTWYYFGFYALATLVLFAEPLFSPSKLIFGTDLLAGNIFFRQFVTDYLMAHGTWPLWDPYIHGGMPFIDGMHGDIFYFVTLFFYMLLGVFYAWGVTIALHVFLAGASMYLFLRGQKIRGSIAFLFGLIYLMMPLFISQVYGGHNGKMFVIAMAPLVFYLFDKAIASGKLLHYLLLSFVLLQVMVTPHMQLAYFLFTTLGVYFVVTIYGMWRKEGRIPWRPVYLFIGAATLGAALSAVQFVSPYAYLSENSMRNIRTDAGQGYEYSTSWSLHWEEAAAHFTPEFCGDDVQGQPSSYWGRNPFKLNSEHFSIIAIFAAILAFGASRRRGRWFFLGTAVVSLLYALGADTPFFHLFYMIPGVSSFRAPSLSSFLTAFAVITLGAYGLEDFLRREKKDEPREKSWKIFTYISIGYTVLGLFLMVAQMGFFRVWFAVFGHTPDPNKLQALQSGMGGITLGVIISLVAVWGLWVMLKLYHDRKLSANVVVIVLALFSFIYFWQLDSRYIISIDPAPHYAKTPVSEFLKARQAEEQFRVLVMPRTLRDWYLAYHGIEELSMSMIHGNHFASFERLAGRRGNSSGLIYQPVQDLLNARYFVSNQPLPPQYFGLGRLKEVQRFGSVIIYENLTALPRAFPIYRYTVVEDQDLIVRTLSDTSFDYRSVLIFEESPDSPPPAYDDSLEFPVVAARVFDVENASFKVEVEMLADGFLFLSENYYKAWKAYEGEKLLPTLRADLTFRAIPLSKGRHEIHCRFENEVFDTAAIVSVIALIATVLGLIVLSAAEFRRRKN
jgi:hypothetical protein